MQVTTLCSDSRRDIQLQHSAGHTMNSKMLTMLLVRLHTSRQFQSISANFSKIPQSLTEAVTFQVSAIRKATEMLTISIGASLKIRKVLRVSARCSGLHQEQVTLPQNMQQLLL